MYYCTHHGRRVEGFPAACVDEDGQLPLQGAFRLLSRTAAGAVADAARMTRLDGRRRGNCKYARFEQRTWATRWLSALPDRRRYIMRACTAAVPRSYGRVAAGATVKNASVLIVHPADNGAPYGPCAHDVSCAPTQQRIPTAVCRPTTVVRERARAQVPFYLGGALSPLRL